MRATPISDEVPELMQDAWHLDAHRGEMPGMLDPAELVAAVFNIPRRELAIGDEVSTGMFGKFYVDELSSQPDHRSILLHTRAPGLTSRFAVAVRRYSDGSREAILHNSVHPTSWLGRVYFRFIEIGHHLVMEVALRRLARAARDSGSAA
jgi:hypothetical protein